MKEARRQKREWKVQEKDQENNKRIPKQEKRSNGENTEGSSDALKKQKPNVTCSKCQLEYDEEDGRVQYYTCDVWYHIICTNINYLGVEQIAHLI